MIWIKTIHGTIQTYNYTDAENFEEACKKLNCSPGESVVRFDELEGLTKHPLLINVGPIELILTTEELEDLFLLSSENDEPTSEQQSNRDQLANLIRYRQGWRWLIKKVGN